MDCAAIFTKATLSAKNRIRCFGRCLDHKGHHMTSGPKYWMINNFVSSRTARLFFCVSLVHLGTKRQVGAYKWRGGGGIPRVRFYTLYGLGLIDVECAFDPHIDGWPGKLKMEGLVDASPSRFLPNPLTRWAIPVLSQIVTMQKAP